MLCHHRPKDMIQSTQCRCCSNNIYFHLYQLSLSLFFPFQVHIFSFAIYIFDVVKLQNEKKRYYKYIVIEGVLLEVYRAPLLSDSEQENAFSYNDEDVYRPKYFIKILYV